MEIESQSLQFSLLEAKRRFRGFSANLLRSFVQIQMRLTMILFSALGEIILWVNDCCIIVTHFL